MLLVQRERHIQLDADLADSPRIGQDLTAHFDLDFVALPLPGIAELRHVISNARAQRGQKQLWGCDPGIQATIRFRLIGHHGVPASLDHKRNLAETFYFDLHDASPFKTQPALEHGQWKTPSDYWAASLLAALAAP